MNNIKQKFIKLIISFCLLALSACSSTQGTGNKRNLSDNITEVALLLPLSGENELVGKQYSSLIKMGLSDNAKVRIKVTAYDSSDELKLKDSIKKILEQRTKIIIGPISSKDTKILAAQVKGKEIVALTLSNDPTLADKNIFVFGHAPMKQMEQVANYLINDDYKNYITLLPAGRHSTTVSKIIQSIVTNKGATLSRMEFYTNSDESIEKVMNVVSDTVDNLNENYENLKRPVIIIGDDPENLKRIYNIAKGFNLDKKAVFAGDSRIDAQQDKDFEILYTGAMMLEDINLKARALALGIGDFSFMHILAYDAGKIVAGNLIQDYKKESFSARLRNLQRFSGVSGKIYFIDSIAQREYEIIRKRGGIYSIQDNPPKTAIQEEVLSVPNK